MKENVLDVLIYLFENHLFDHEEHEPGQEFLTLELSEAGFERNLIDRAFDWLENLDRMRERIADDGTISSGVIRHYTPDEAECIDAVAQGLLLELEQYGVLDAFSREMVISQLTSLGVDHIDMKHLKWVILMVLSNYFEGEEYYELSESSVLYGLHTCIH